MRITPKQIVLVSLGLASIVAVVGVLDMTLGVVYGREIMMDVMLTLSSAIVIYLAISVYRELT